MQVVILAGGEGSRLRPLTADTPKPLVRLLGVPVIERLTALLFKCGFREATVADWYLADKLEKSLGSLSNGVKLRYVREDVPLGTAGCVRRAWDVEDDVLVVSGDSVCEFDFSRIAGYFEKTNADVVIVTHRVADPREYGLVTAGSDGRITGFIEKPGYDSCLTDVANTGTYVISREIIKRIPQDERVDFASDVFPALIAEGKRLYSFTEGGIWHDIGDIPAFLRCQDELLELEKRDNLIIGGELVDNSAVIGGSVIERGVSIARDCRVQDSCVMAGASLAEGCTLSRCVVAENASIGRGCMIGAMCALGSGCVIGSAATVEPGVRIASGAVIPPGTRVRYDVTGEGCAALDFGDCGEAAGIGGDAVSMVNLGCAIASGLDISQITIGCQNGVGWAECIAIGLRECGASVYMLENASFAETVMAARSVGTRYCIYSDGQIRLIRSDRIELSRSEERKIEQAFNRGGFRKLGGEIPPAINAEAVSAVYRRKLAEAFPRSAPLNVSIKTDCKEISRQFASATNGCSFSGREDAEFIVFRDRKTVSCKIDGKRIAPQTLLILACKSKIALDGDRELYLDRNAPLACETAAAELGGRVIRVGPADDMELSQFCFDPLFLIAQVLRLCHETQKSLGELIAELPEIVYTDRVIDTDAPLPKLLAEDFGGLDRNGRIVLESEGAKAFIRPAKSGKSLMVYLESVSQEAANQLCGEILGRLGLGG